MDLIRYLKYFGSQTFKEGIWSQKNTFFNLFYKFYQTIEEDLSSKILVA